MTEGDAANARETMDGTPATIDTESVVRARYGAAARAKETALCCPVSYDPRYLERIPQEIRDKDYGCGDPSLYVQPGDTVLDLGSGGGKICYIAAQIVGRKGRVIGVDFNPEMLGLARKYRREMAQPAVQRLLALLAALSLQTNFSVGCYCEDESRCHRSLLKRLLRERGAQIVA